MTEQEALAKMIAPGTRRETKWMGGVIQVWTTNACDKSCFNCTQGGNLRGPYDYITVDNFEKACQSLKGYWGVVGMFGANPALHPSFDTLCEIMSQHIPYRQRGIWCNNPITPRNAEIMRRTFNPAYSNLNVHLDQHAYDLFKVWWPESNPVGLTTDSRHSPVHLAMRDVIADEGKRWQLISSCDINRYWSAMVCQFRGELRAFFCEVAGAQAMLHQHEPNYPDTGLKVEKYLYCRNDSEATGHADNRVSFIARESQIPQDSSHAVTVLYMREWWELPMSLFAAQVRKHCHSCAVPLKGYGELAQSEEGVEQTSATHAAVYRPKKKYRPVQVVTNLQQLGIGKIQKMTDYLGNAAK